MGGQYGSTKIIKTCFRKISDPYIIRICNKRGQEIGYENVFDYSLGNPSVPVVQDYTDNTIRLLQTKTSSELHGYSPSVGLPHLKKRWLHRLTSVLI